MSTMIGTTTIIFTISLALLSVINYLAIKLYLYWYYSWFDMPVHFFSGAIVALGMFTAAELVPRWPRRWLRFWPVFLWVVMIALLWEVFELYAGIPIKPDYEIDTITDLIMGCSGGVVGYFVGKSLRYI